MTGEDALLAGRCEFCLQPVPDTLQVAAVASEVVGVRLEEAVLLELALNVGDLLIAGAQSETKAVDLIKHGL